MKITVEISDSDLKEICRITGERKKGPALRRFVTEALLLNRRAVLARKFITGTWSVQLKSLDTTEKTDRTRDAKNARRWRSK